MIKQRLFRNFANPQGLLGRLAGQIMARKSANTERGLWAVAEMDPLPDSKVLEVGYGPGVAIAAMADAVPGGKIVGVDLSAVMQAQARRRNAEHIQAGRVELRVGDAQALDPDLVNFDLVYGINVWQFWTDQMATVKALSNSLAPTGRLALVYMQPPTASTDSDGATSLLTEQFAAAGLTQVEVRTMAHDPPAVMVIGHAHQ